MNKDDRVSVKKIKFKISVFLVLGIGHENHNRLSESPSRLITNNTIEKHVQITF